MTPLFFVSQGKITTVGAVQSKVDAKRNAGISAEPIRRGFLTSRGGALRSEATLTEGKRASQDSHHAVDAKRNSGLENYKSQLLTADVVARFYCSALVKVC